MGGRIGRTAFARQSPRDEWGRTGTASIAWVPIHDERNEERAMNIVSTGTRRNASFAG
ncbi:hypothetical protein C7S13_2885 [Burkholderia cepacia]|nr:hypothetical protein [Burkholderia cepacia]